MFLYVPYFDRQILCTSHDNKKSYVGLCQSLFFILYIFPRLEFDLSISRGELGTWRVTRLYSGDLTNVISSSPPYNSDPYFSGSNVLSPNCLPYLGQTGVEGQHFLLDRRTTTEFNQIEAINSFFKAESGGVTHDM